MNLIKMLEDQRAFNSLIHNRRLFDSDRAATIDRIKNLTMGVMEEALEFLRTFEFKVHRRSKVRLQNVAHSHEELIDMFKYWLSLVDITDFPIEQLEELYYAKSRVVQYRYQEEWLKEVVHPSVVVDIDNVLGDYIRGIAEWALKNGHELMELSPADSIRVKLRLQELVRKRSWIDADSVGVTHMQWQQVKHDFRTRGGKRWLPVFDDAKPFLEWCRAQGWTILLITSRPVGLYPNIFTDTLTWLHESGLPFDHVWWADNKTERLEEAHVVLRSQIVFAVDDSQKFVEQFARKGVKTYWLVRENETLAENFGPNVTVVKTLTELMEKEIAHHVL